MKIDTAKRLGIEFACQRLAYEFCYLSDHGRYEDYAQVFAVDGVFQKPGVEVKGRAEILEAIRRRPANLKTRHLCANVLIEVVDDTRATGTGTHLYVLHDTSSNTTHPAVVVDFTDGYVLTEEGWKIARRSVQQAF